MPEPQPASEPKKSIITRLKGGIGNQLFQYATARALAIETDSTLIIDRGWYDRKSRPRSYRLAEFQIAQNTISNTKAQLQLMMLKRPLTAINMNNGPAVITEPKDLSYRPFKSSLPQSILLEGYWQSYKYFDQHRATILKDLKLADTIDKSSLTQPAANTVAVHIRRGDYITTSSAHVVTEKYVKAAMAEFGSNANFLFFSDDLDWCNETFGGDNVGFSEQPSDLMDLIQMSLCSHNIIANSSFSWWSAWLNENENQRVIAPKPWTAGGNTHRDILPQGWETLPIS